MQSPSSFVEAHIIAISDHKNLKKERYILLPGDEDELEVFGLAKYCVRYLSKNVHKL